MADAVVDSDAVEDPDAVEIDSLLHAWHTARAELLVERNAQGYWIGELASSPLSTATAVSALSIAEQHARSMACTGADAAGEREADRWDYAYQTDLSELICNALRWLAGQQNEDGGWGDTDRSQSNLATTLLVLSAFRMTGVPAKFAELEPKAEQYLRDQGGVPGLKKRYGSDKTFAAPILANGALAGIVPWSQVPTLPFELAALPRDWFHRVGMPVVSYALPALVAIGLAKLHHHPPVNPLARGVRRLVTERCLGLVTSMQPDSGGFLEATPLTSFVVMALASTGRADHPVVRRGVEFLLASARADGSWPIDTNLATWNTSLAVNALRKGSDRLPHTQPTGKRPANGRPTDAEPAEDGRDDQHARQLDFGPTCDWLLACQHTQRHPFTDAEPGGWGWTNLSGGVPDTDDTSGALLALHGRWAEAVGADRTRLAVAVGRGVRWLLDMQNRDGGWPTFCRGWGKLPFDRSATDLTAHALRALHAWRHTPGWWTADAGGAVDANHNDEVKHDADSREADHASRADCAARGGNADRLADADLDGKIDQAIAGGLAYLRQEQTPEGAWLPLWFGNETRPNQANPVFGASKVLKALAEVEGLDSPMARRGLQYLTEQQLSCGGWGGDPSDPASPDGGYRHSSRLRSSVEETAVALESLLPWKDFDATICRCVERATGRLVRAVHAGELAEPAPIGLYFAKLWYHERLYPKTFTVSALGAAVEGCVASTERKSNDRVRSATEQVSACS
ncbi:MAG: prenyltransferase/squalene oxidase repeat-containing protein [Planctomycetota bacterium]